VPESGELVAGAEVGEVGALQAVRTRGKINVIANFINKFLIDMLKTDFCSLLYLIFIFDNYLLRTSLSSLLICLDRAPPEKKKS